jgi:hypothetical protein
VKLRGVYAARLDRPVNLAQARPPTRYSSVSAGLQQKAALADSPPQSSCRGHDPQRKVSIPCWPPNRENRTSSQTPKTAPPAPRPATSSTLTAATMAAPNSSRQHMHRAGDVRNQ